MTDTVYAVDRADLISHPATMPETRTMAERVPFDVTAYERRTRTGECFICGFLGGEPDLKHELLYDDGAHVAFLNRYPTLRGYALVAPRCHVEDVVRDFTPDEYLALQAVVHRVARAINDVVATERTYVLSLGSMQGNAHVHWHIAPLPPGVPYQQQQFHALMAENGILQHSPRRNRAPRGGDPICAAVRIPLLSNHPWSR